MSNINTMIDRAGEILEYLYETDDLVGVSHIAAALDMPKASVFRILTTLEKWHIVEKVYHTDQYKLGMALIKYGARVSANLSLVELSKPIIDDLAETLNEGVYLNIEHQDYSLNIYKRQSTQSSLMTNLIPLSPLNCSASGKLFLTNRDPLHLRTYFSSKMCEKRTINSVMTEEAYQKHVDKYRETGFMYDDEEYEYGLFCTSMPIIYRGNIVATVSVSGPKTRLEVKGLETIEQVLATSVQAIGDLVEYLEPEKLYLK